MKTPQHIVLPLGSVNPYRAVSAAPADIDRNKKSELRRQVQAEPRQTLRIQTFCSRQNTSLFTAKAEGDESTNCRRFVDPVIACIDTGINLEGFSGSPTAEEFIFRSWHCGFILCITSGKCT